ncbi:MAG: sensor histidine kinase [Actinomycetota bacterium]|nr:sensor histidine kinase [Actinomycetota bacterium]
MSADRRDGRAGALPLTWRIFLANAAVFALAIVMLALTPATVSHPVTLAEATILAAGLAAILVINLFLVRRSLTSLSRLTSVMRSVDLLRPGQRVESGGPAEVRELGAVFNEMLERLERDRRESGVEALRAQETERKRVAQELHDEVGQEMTALMLQLGRIAASAPQDVREELHEAQEAARAALDDVRGIARQLRPEALDDLGLVPALTALSLAFAERTGVRVERRLESELPALSPEAELVIFRVAQESLTNAARHADTARVIVRLERVLDAVRLTVRDYGRGLNGAQPGSGIRGMRERALLVGADFALDSRDDAGTEVVLDVPVAGR